MERARKCELCGTTAGQIVDRWGQAPCLHSLSDLGSRLTPAYGPHPKCLEAIIREGHHKQREQEAAARREQEAAAAALTPSEQDIIAAQGFAPDDLIDAAALAIAAARQEGRQAERDRLKVVLEELAADSSLAAIAILKK